MLNLSIFCLSKKENSLNNFIIKWECKIRSLNQHNFMASLYSPPPPLSITPKNAASRTPLSAFYFCPFLIRNHKSKAPKVAKPSQYSVSSVSCKATNDGDPEKHSKENKEPINNVGMFERRNILIGLGGLYGTAATLSNDTLSLADPILPPDITKCVPAQVAEKNLECCPPVLSKPIDYKLPANPRVKMRPAAQFVDATYIRNYKEAVRRIKALPADDPRNFYQQAKVHCAYCNGGYQQVGFPNIDLQVHNSWIFFPFHRWYLYFYERILGSLIKDLDPNFALPFWNWDSDLDGGMQIPAYYADPNSPLYDSLRNPKHVPLKLVDLDYNPDEKEPTITPEEQISANFTTMYRTIVSTAKLPSLFFGGEYRAGNTEPSKLGRGTVESVPHGAVHGWTGLPDGLQEDMGNLFSPARDPVFYSHHANIDRLWPIWKSLGGKRKDITDPDWLESGFVFYDENKNLVRVKVKDCLDTKKLGYDYQQVYIPWLETKPKATPGKGRFQSTVKKKFGAGGAPLSAETFQESKFPLVLDSSTVSTAVKRPKKNRSKAEKEEEEEVLVIEEIEFERDLPLKFDIYINDEDDVPGGPTKTEFAGSFVHVPHGHKEEKNNMQTRFRIGITELLEDLGADDDELLVVTLVPKFKKGKITIGGIKIEFDK